MEMAREPLQSGSGEASVPRPSPSELGVDEPSSPVHALANEEVLPAYVVKKRGGDEVRHIPPEEAEAWRDTDGAEWEKIRDTGAIKALSLEAS
eukprot:s4878_g7.t1